MCTTIRIVLAMVREAFLSRAALHLENLALRQQLAALVSVPKEVDSFESFMIL